MAILESAVTNLCGSMAFPRSALLSSRYYHDLVHLTKKASHNQGLTLLDLHLKSHTMTSNKMLIPCKSSGKVLRSAFICVDPESNASSVVVARGQAYLRLALEVMVPTVGSVIDVAAC